MTTDWPKRELGELCDFKNGLWKGKKGPFIRAGVIRNTNFRKNGQLDDSNIAYIDVEEKQLGSRKLEYGDLILEKSGGGPKQPVGRVVLFEKKEGTFSFSNFTSYIRIRDKGVLEPTFLHRYLHYLYLSGATEPMQKHSTNIRNLQLNEYKKIRVPLPAVPEQKRIVAILDEAFAGIDAAIANTEKNLINARNLFRSSSRSLFHESEQWERCTLAELLERGWIKSHLDGNHGSDYPRKSEFVDEGVPYLSANCINDDSVNLGASKFLKPERASRLRKGIAHDGDVLFAHNATVGPVAILKTESEKIVLSTSLTYYRCDERYIYPAYLAHYMRSPLFREQFEAVMRQSTRNQVPITKQRSFYHLIPPLDKQKEIADHLDSLRNETLRLESLYSQKTKALADLKQSLLNKAFSGELATGKTETEAREAIA